jgi:hypothetical protein
VPANPARRSTRQGECRGREGRRSQSFTPFNPQQNLRPWKLRTLKDVKKETGKGVLEEEAEKKCKRVWPLS